MNLWSLLIGLGGSFFVIWASLKYLILMEMRVDSSVFKTLYQISKSQRKIVIHEGLSIENKYPPEFRAICFFKKAPWFFLSHQERLLNAGWQGHDTTSHITCFRWSHSKLKNYLLVKLKEEQINTLGIPVELIMPHYVDRIGTLKINNWKLFLDPKIYKDFENEIKECLEGKRNKTGMLLYGSPGNGKTSFLKYIATKYSLPIKIVTFSPDFSNHDIMMIFSQITSNSLVIFEDFDNYFDGRKCIIGDQNMNIKFTFDTILNGLDGVYNSYEKAIFIMTANDISKIDNALKNRPSRFKYVKELSNPSGEIRKQLLPEEWIEKTEGFNLDQVFMIKQFCEAGYNLEDSLEKMNRLESIIPDEIRLESL